MCVFEYFHKRNVESEVSKICIKNMKKNLRQSFNNGERERMITLSDAERARRPIGMKTKARQMRIPMT